MKPFIVIPFFKFFHFLFLVFPLFSLDVFIAPPNSNQCALKVSNPCNGSQNNPYDNLMTAFIQGVSQAIQSNDFLLNYYLYPTNTTDGHLIIHTSSSNVTTSPFEAFLGEINIVTWMDKSGSATILVKTDNFTMVVNKGLTIKNIVFMGFDMHMVSYPCIENVCCWPNPEISLFNSSDHCFLDQRSVVRLFLQDISIKYFNAFQNIRSFIYTVGNSTEIVIDNVTIDQMFLPQSLVFIENSYDLQLSISNFFLLRYNVFQVWDEILTTPTMMNFKSSEGILTFDQIYLEYTWIQNCFEMENDNLTITFENLKISAMNDNCNGECFIFSISSSFSQITLYDIHIFSLISFVRCDDNLIFSLIRGSFSEARAKIMGNNNSFTINSITISYSSKESISVYGQNNFILVQNSNILQNSHTFFVLYYESSSNTIIFDNTIIDGSQTIFGVILVVSSELMDFNNIVFNSSIIRNVPQSSSGFFQLWKYSKFTIYNCLFTNNYFSSQGIFFLYDDFNSVDIIKSSLNVTHSTGSGAIFGTCCSNLANIKLNIFGSNFVDTVSELFGNIYSGKGIIDIKNSTFIGSSSFVGNLIQAMFSNITIFNNFIINASGGLVGQFSLMKCTLMINNTSFQNADGDDSVFAVFSFSNIWISNSDFSNFSYSGSFLFLDTSNNFLIANSTFENFKEEDGILFISLLNNSIIFSNITLSNIIHSGLFFGTYTSYICLQNMMLTNVSAEYIITLGSDDNFIEVIKLIASNIVVPSGFFNIWPNNRMNISNSSFENCSGGVIYLNQAEVDIKACKFIHSSASVGSVIYTFKSNITMNGCILNGSISDMVASAIYCEYSSLTINFTQFSFSSVTSLSNGADSVFFWKGDMSPSNYIISFNSVDFSNNRENLIYVEGKPNLISIANSSFSNNKATLMIVVQSVFLQFQSLLFFNNTSNDFVRFVSGIITVNLQDCIFVNNTFCNSFFSATYVVRHLIPFYNFNTIKFLNNQIMGTNQGAFFLISYGNALNFTNLTAKDNLMLKDFSINVVLIKLFQCDSILINGFYRSNNFLQALSVQKCFIYMYNLMGSLKGNLLFSIIDSTFIFDSGVIKTENDLYQFDLSNKLPIIKSTNSNISIFNMTMNLGRNITKDLNFTVEFNSGCVFFMRNCSFLSNTSIFIQIIGFPILFIEASTFEITANNDLVTAGYLYILNSTNIFVDNCNITKFGALNSSAGLMISTAKQTMMRCFISNSAFTGNKGTSGAAIYIRGLNSIFFYKNRFTFNKASPLGGAFYLSCFLKSQCILVLNESIFSGNQAEIGGSIFLENAYSYNISRNRFINDSINAYLRKNSIMTSPYSLNLTQIVDEFGKIYEFGASDQNKVVEINNQQRVSFYFSIYDAANRKCTFDENSLVWFTKNALSSSSIQVVKGDVSFSSQGDVYFPSFQIFADFNTIYNFTVQMNGLFDLNKSLSIKTRICRIGEYYEAGTCLPCPINSYSLTAPLFRGSKQEGLSSCLPCPANSICQGHIIAPQQDYWISPSRNSTLLLKCPSSACIYVDFSQFKGIVPCAEGQKGALCIMCKEGYTKDSFDGLCGKCETGGAFLGFMFMKLGFMLIFVSYQVYNKIFVKSLIQDGLQSIYLKIIRDHFNQVFLIFTVSGGLQFDDIMSLFYQKSNNVVTGSTLSLDCFFENRMDMFYYLIISLAISPIYMQIFISLIFFLVFIFKLIMGRRVQFHFFLKSMFALFIVVCDTQYTSILGAFFKFFQCTHLDSTNSRQYLLFAPHIECYSDNHILYILTVGLPCFLIWVIGLPIFYLFLLRIMRNTGGLRKASKEMCRFGPIGFESSRYNSNISTLATFRSFKTMADIPEGMFERDLDASLMLAFLYADFKGKRYYWTSTIMIWKFVMCVIVNFIPARYAYFTLFIFYCVLLLIYEKLKPYKDNSCMNLLKLSFLANMISIILTMFNTSSNESLYKGIGIIYVIVQCFFFAVAGYLIIVDLDLSKYLEMVGKYLSEKQNAGKIVNSFGNKLISKFSRRRSTIAGIPSLNIVQPNSDEKLKNGDHETNNEIITEKIIEMKEFGKKFEGNGSRKTKHKNVSFIDDQIEKGTRQTIIVLPEPEQSV